VAIYLKPRRGAQATAKDQNIGLKKGEIFLEFPVGRIGREPGRIVIGDGATSYDRIVYGSTSTNEFQPFITDPSIYIPRFANTSTSTGEGQISPAFESINKMGNGSTMGEKLPIIVGAIKESLIYHANSLSEIYEKFTSGFNLYGNATTHSVEAARDKYTWIGNHGTYTTKVENDSVSVNKQSNGYTYQSSIFNDSIQVKSIYNNSSEYNNPSNLEKYANLTSDYLYIVNNGNDSTATYGVLESQLNHSIVTNLDNNSTITRDIYGKIYAGGFETYDNASSVVKISNIPNGTIKYGKITSNSYSITLENATTSYPGFVTEKNKLEVTPKDVIRYDKWANKDGDESLNNTLKTIYGGRIADIQYLIYCLDGYRYRWNGTTFVNEGRYDEFNGWGGEIRFILTDVNGSTYKKDVQIPLASNHSLIGTIIGLNYPSV
jgi:hypothetical protein